MVIDISLPSSSLNGAKLLPTFPSNKTRKCPPKFFSMSCRASSKMASEHGAAASSFYKLLSLSSNRADVEEIKRSYRKLALRYHPDVCRDPSLKKESTETFVLLQTAYKMLSDPLLRAEYDYELGLASSGRVRRNGGVSDRNRGEQSKWEAQIVELRKRSNCRAGQREGPWASRLRHQNISKYGGI